MRRGGGDGIPAGVDAERARDAARDILSGAEYAEPQPGIVERAMDWVFDRAGSFLGTLTGGGPGSVVGWLVVLVLVGLALALLVRALRVPAPRATVADGRHVAHRVEMPRDPAAWLREADRLAAAGDHRGALRCRYQAMLARLVADRVVDDLPGRTATEYRRLLDDRLPERRDDLHALTERFERVWYGGASVDADELARFGAACGSVERDADRLVRS